MPYLAAVSQRNPAMVLKMAAGIDKYVITDFNILSEIRIERREHAKRGRHGLSEKFGEQRPHLVRSIIGSIQFKCNTSRLITHFVHKVMYLFRIESLSCLYIFQKIIKCHITSY